MKLSAGYVVFDGIETLEGSIRSIRESVDLILVSYQTISWGNTKCSDKLLPLLESLKSQGLIDELLYFTEFIPSTLISGEEVIRAKSFECKKRQTLLDRSKELGATHYLSMDADEFYIKAEFEKAKNQIISDNLQATAVRYINYLTPILHQGYSKFRVPFIYEIGPNSRHHAGQFIFADIDPTRGITDDAYVRARIFNTDMITMHHMEMMRDDLVGKYTASSRFFRNRAELSILAEDIELAKTTGELRFRSIHFGDSLSGLNKTLELISCTDQFGLMTNSNSLR